MKAPELPFKRGQPDKAPCSSFGIQLLSDFPLHYPSKLFLVSPDTFTVCGNGTLGVGPSQLGPYEPQTAHVWCPNVILHASCLIGTFFLQQALMILA